MAADSAVLRQLARSAGGRNGDFAQFADGILSRLETAEETIGELQEGQTAGYVGWGFLYRAISTLADMPPQAPAVTENRGSGVEIALFNVGARECYGFVLAPGLYSMTLSEIAEARVHSAFPANAAAVTKLGSVVRPAFALEEVSRLWFYPDGSTEPHLSCQVRRLA